MWRSLLVLPTVSPRPWQTPQFWIKLSSGLNWDYLIHWTRPGEGTDSESIFYYFTPLTLQKSDKGPRVPRGYPRTYRPHPQSPYKTTVRVGRSEVESTRSPRRNATKMRNTKEDFKVREFPRGQISCKIGRSDSEVRHGGGRRPFHLTRHKMSSTRRSPGSSKRGRPWVQERQTGHSRPLWHQVPVQLGLL